MLDEDESIFQPWKEGAATFASFLVCGFIPLIAYIVAIAASGSTSSNVAFAVECALTAVTLFALGCVKSTFTGERWWAAGLWVLFIGSVAAGASFLIGWGLGELLRGGGSLSSCNSTAVI